jgi:transposase
MSAAQIERLQEHLQRLRLFKSRERLEALLQDATTKECSYADFLDQVLSEEVASKTAKHVTMRTQLARFPFVKSLDSFDFSYQPSIDRKQIQLKPAAERFGLDRKTVREWRDRAKVAGEAGLVPRYPKRRPRRIPDATVHLIAEARREFGWGACRTRLWLLRVHQIKVAAKTIARICVDLGLPRAQGCQSAATGAAATQAVREGNPGRVRPGRRQGGERQRDEGLPVHGLRRLHSLPRPAPLPPAQYPNQCRLPGRAPPRAAVFDPAGAN